MQMNMRLEMEVHAEPGFIAALQVNDPQALAKLHYWLADKHAIQSCSCGTVHPMWKDAPTPPKKKPRPWISASEALFWFCGLGAGMFIGGLL